jgi:hypothetical protein
MFKVLENTSSHLFDSLYYCPLAGDLLSLFVLAHFAVAGPVALYGLASQLACVRLREMHGCWYGQTGTRMLGWTNGMD